MDAGYARHIRFGAILLVLFVAQGGRVDRLRPLLLDEDDRVCWRIYGDMNTVQSCLVRAASEELDFVENTEASLKEVLRGEQEKVLRSAQEAWKRNVDATCNELYALEYRGGSLTRTEPIRCVYFMYADRESILETLYDARDASTSGRYYYGLEEDGKICWNPYGWSGEMACLKEYSDLADQSLAQRVFQIFGENPSETEPEISAAFETAQEAWRDDRESTCDQLMRVLHAGDEMQKPLVVWCRFLMTRLRERLLLRLYEFRLHQKGITVRH